MKKLIIVVLCSLVFVGGCTTLENVMSSWVGEKSDNLLASWGAPDSTIQLDNGGKVLTWTTLEGGGEYPLRTCRKSFTVNSSGIIESWSYSDCDEFLWK